MGLSERRGFPALKAVLSNLIEAIRFIGVLLTPFLPDTAASIMEQIGSPAADLDSLKEFGSAPARKVGEAKALFARIDEAKMMERINKEIVEPQIAAAKAEASKNAPAEKKEAPEGIAQIGIEDFSKVELRVAEVLSCEKMKKSKKLLKLILNDGDGERQVLSGISQWYAPEDLVGKKIVLVSNLKPAKLCGEVSNGMILAADCSEDDVKVLFVDPSVPAGSRIH